MTTAQAIIAAAGLLAVAGVALVVRLWWKGRSRDVSSAQRALVLAIAATVLMVPVMALAWAGAPGVLAVGWMLLLPVVWGSVGVTNVVEQRHARARDVALGAPLRPVLWHPWLVGAVAAIALFACMLATLVAVFAVSGDVSTSLIMATGSSVLWGSFILASTQALRLAVARGQSPTDLLTRLEEVPHRNVVAAAALVAGTTVLVAGVAAASLLQFGAGTPTDLALALASTPGWALVSLGWLVGRPQRRVIGEGLAD